MRSASPELISATEEDRRQQDQQQLPSCPLRVYDGREKVADTCPSTDDDLESNSKEKTKDGGSMAPKAPWWSRYSGYQKLKLQPPSIHSRQARRGVLAAFAACAIILTVVLVWLHETHRLGSGKVCAKHFFILVSLTIACPCQNLGKVDYGVLSAKPVIDPLSLSD